MKKLLSVFLAIAMLLNVSTIMILNVSSVDSSSQGIYNRLLQIRNVYPSGSYFTKSGELCASNTAEDCRLSNIPPRGGLSKGAEAARVCGDGSSCCGFARYVFYNTFYHDAESSSYSTKVSIDNAKPGDFVVFRWVNNSGTTSEHYGIFLSYDSNYVYVYDSNYTTTPTNKVGWETKVVRSRLSHIWHSNSYSTYNSQYGGAYTLEVYFNANGGSISSDDYKLSSDVVYNKSDSTKYYQQWIYNNTKENGLVNYTTLGLYKTGYTFTGWGTSASGGTVFDQGDNTLKPTDINSDVKNGDCTKTLYAQWRKNVLTVSFNANGGSISSDTYKLSSNVICNKSDGSKATQIWNYGNLKDNGLMNYSTFGIYKTGYSFAGWGSKASGGTVFDQADNTLTAVDINTNIKDGDCSSTLYAQWKANNYTVTFNANGGACSTSSKKVSYDSTYGTLPTPTKTGYAFKGWYTATSGGTKITADNKVSTASNQTLYAQWTPNVLTVSFNANGGSISSDTYKLSSDAICNKSDGSKATQVWNYGIAKDNGLMNDSTFGIYKAGYSFAGWGTKASGGTVFDQGDNALTAVNINANIKNGDCSSTLYAQWTPNVLTVYFNANGGSIASDTYKLSSDVICNKSDGSKATQIWNYGKEKSDGLMNDTTFGIYKTGYSFTGWGSKASGGTVFDQGDDTLTAVNINSNIKNGNCSSTLYAQWKANTYTVTFNANGGSCSTATKKVTYDSTYGTLPIPTRTGYVFDGWYTATSGGTKITAENKVSTASNQTLYARWTQVTLSSISVKTNPSDVSYCVGEKLNTSGLTLTAKYSDGSIKTISSGFTCSPTALNTTGVQKITVTYSDKTTSFNVTVNAHAQKTTVTDSTCMTTGKTVVSCSVCGMKLSETVIPTKAHTPSAAVEENRVEASCAEKGSYDLVIRCSVCNKEISRETKEIAPSNKHDFGSWTITTEPTTTSTGEKERRCSACGTTETVIIPKTGITAIITDSEGNIIKEEIISDELKEISFENLANGEYTVTISKGDYVTREYTILATEGKAICEFNINKAGDLTGDGRVNAIDVARANAHAKGVSVLSGYEFACVDVNGDGKVNAIDVALINAHSKGTKALW